LAYETGKVLRDVINVHHIELLNSVIAKHGTKGVPAAIIPVEPKRLTERIARQQGLFLVPTDGQKLFGQNLADSLPLDSFRPVLPLSTLLAETDCSKRYPVLKVTIPREVGQRGLLQLLKMNISMESLFPGLEGLAKSLAQRVIE
jgi:hypothetical protein